MFYVHESQMNPDSEYLKVVPEHLRSYEEAVSYWPNQTGQSASS